MTEEGPEDRKPAVRLASHWQRFRQGPADVGQDQLASVMQNISHDNTVVHFDQYLPTGTLTRRVSLI